MLDEFIGFSEKLFNAQILNKEPISQGQKLPNKLIPTAMAQSAEETLALHLPDETIIAQLHLCKCLVYEE